jgi:hypothetical protein
MTAIQEPVDNPVEKSRKNSDFLPSSSCSLNKNQTEITLEEQEQESEKFRLLLHRCHPYWHP